MKKILGIVIFSLLLNEKAFACGFTANASSQWVGYILTDRNGDRLAASRHTNANINPEIIVKSAAHLK